MKILIIHGPNLPFLGKIPVTTGTRLTLDKINTNLRRQARELGVELKIYQLYSEEKIIKTVARSRHEINGIVLAPGALAHNCPVLVELITILKIPFVEVHLSEMPDSTVAYEQSQLQKLALKKIIAPGWEAYRQGLLALIQFLNPQRNN